MDKTIKEAARMWVETFNAIPVSAVEKLSAYDHSIKEITPLHKGMRVYTTDNRWKWEDGEILSTSYNGDYDYCVVKLDIADDPVVINRDCIEKSLDGIDEFPAWGTMWSFGEKIDEDWLLGTYWESHLEEMAEIGFRIYDSEDFGTIFGLDAGGFDFYEAFWVPLYKLRGLKWHKEDTCYVVGTL